MAGMSPYKPPSDVPIHGFVIRFEWRWQWRGVAMAERWQWRAVAMAERCSHRPSGWTRGAVRVVVGGGGEAVTGAHLVGEVYDGRNHRVHILLLDLGDKPEVDEDELAVCLVVGAHEVAGVGV